MIVSKNDEAWNALFDKYQIGNKIERNGYYIITSEEINQFREARLMTKFDHRFQLPQIFIQEGLSILPISRGSYILAPISAYCDFHTNNNIEVQNISIPSYLESLDYNNITSEAMAINCAYVSGIIADFTEETDLMPTVSGRMSSENFKFEITSGGNKNLKIEVNNSQIEIDGGYEGLRSLNLIEAKNTISNDFLIRQLYYPYRLWRRKVSKFVRPIFIEYTNGIYHLREYAFEDINHYNSIKLVKEKKYYLKDDSSRIINLQLLSDIADSITIVEESIDVPFPQADSFERIVNLCEIINGTKEGYILKDELSENYSFTEKVSFDKRQVDYYTNAASYLGLIEKGKDPLGNIYYELSDIGKKIFSVSLIDRQLVFVKLILSHRPFNETFKLYLQRAEVPSKDMIVSIMQHSMLNNVGSRTTYYRRASTIISWINWIINLIYE